jgi:hypothetical protein
MIETAERTRVTIDHWVNTFVVASAPGSARAILAPGAEEVPQRIRQFEQFVSEELPSSCKQWLPQLVDLSSSAVWHIRALDLRFLVDVAPSSGVEAEQAWGEQVATRISHIIDRGPNKDVVRFESRAAYLAQFALDLAAGRAWDLWYYQQFLALRLLPAGRAIVEALTREPRHGADAILSLATDGRLDEVLPVLTDNDAQQIYSRSFSGAHGSANLAQLSPWCGRLLELLNDSPMPSSQNAGGEFHDGLRWLARAALRFPGAEQDPNAVAALDGLLKLRRVLAPIRSPLVADRLVRGLVTKRMIMEDAVREARKHGALSPEYALGFLAAVGNGDPDWASLATSVLLRDQHPAAQAWISCDSMITPFGGLFLLGPPLADLQVNQIAEAATTEAHHIDELAGLLRHVALVKCVGKVRARVALTDPAVQLLSGYRHSEPLKPEPELTNLDWAGAFATFTRRLVALTNCAGRCLLLETVPLLSGNSTVLVIRDVALRLSLHATAWPDRSAERQNVICTSLSLVRAATGNMPYVLLRGQLAGFADAQALRAQCDRPLVHNDEDVDGDVTDFLVRTGCLSDKTTSEQVTRLLRSSEGEFAYLSLGDIWPECSANMDLLSTLIASATLRVFAGRLKGFAASTPEHLHSNFLDGAGLVSVDEERIQVDLPRSPLALVLQLSGLSRQRYRVPWLNGREIWLQPAKQ